LLNQHIEKTLNIRSEEVNKNPEILLGKVNREDREKLQKVVQDIREGKMTKLYHEAKLVDGDITKDIEIILIPIGTDRPFAIIGIARDITHKKEWEKEIIEKYEGWEIAFDSVPDPITILDKNFTILQANKSVFDVLPDVNVVGMKCYEVFHNADSPPDFCPCIKTLEDGQTHSVEMYEERLGGIFNVITSPIIKEGKIVGAVHILHNVSEQKEMNRKLRESETRYRYVFERLPLAFVVWDTETKVIEWNKTAEKLFGWKRDEVVGKSFFDLIIPEDEEELVQNVVENLLKGMQNICENKNLTKDGRTIVCRWHNTPIFGEDGRVIYVLSMGEDVTDKIRLEERKKELEEQLTEAEKLAAIGEFAAGVAHEVNNPLTAIINYAELLLDDAEKEEEKEYLDGIIKEGKRIRDIVRRLLSFSRKEKPKLEKIHLDEVVEETLKLMKYELGKRKICVEKEYRAMPFIYADKNMMKQVFLNLFTNSIHALDKKQSSEKLIKIAMDTTKEKEYLRITFEDNGIGIKKEHLNRIFDPFFTTKRMGTGLGLSLVHGIVKSHGGVIRVESEEGVYTRFKILLPIVPPFETRENVYKFIV
jgi:PAS domain S-box-containing protein